MLFTNAQYVTLQKYFGHPSVYNPTHKTETGIANRWETTNNNPLRPIKLYNQSEETRSSQKIRFDSVYSRLCPKIAYPAISPCQKW